MGSVLWQGGDLNEDLVSGTALSRVNVDGHIAEAYYGYGGCTGSGNCVAGPGGEFDNTFNTSVTWNASTSYTGASPSS